VRTHDLYKNSRKSQRFKVRWKANRMGQIWIWIKYIISKLKKIANLETLRLGTCYVAQAGLKL
jgi:hypothetical protein